MFAEACDKLGRRVGYHYRTESGGKLVEVLEGDKCAEFELPGLGEQVGERFVLEVIGGFVDVDERRSIGWFDRNSLENCVKSLRDRETSEN